METQLVRSSSVLPIRYFPFCSEARKHFYGLCPLCCACGLSCVWLFVTPWTVAHQAPLPMELSRQEHWSELLFPPAGNLSHPGLNPHFLRPVCDFSSLTFDHEWTCMTFLGQWNVSRNDVHLFWEEALSANTYTAVCSPRPPLWGWSMFQTQAALSLDSKATMEQSPHPMCESCESWVRDKTIFSHWIFFLTLFIFGYAGSSLRHAGFL